MAGRDIFIQQRNAADTCWENKELAGTPNKVFSTDNNGDIALINSNVLGNYASFGTCSFAGRGSNNVGFGSYSAVLGGNGAVASGSHSTAFGNYESITNSPASDTCNAACGINSSLIGNTAISISSGSVAHNIALGYGSFNIGSRARSQGDTGVQGGIACNLSCGRNTSIISSYAHNNQNTTGISQNLARGCRTSIIASEAKTTYDTSVAKNDFGIYGAYTPKNSTIIASIADGGCGGKAYNCMYGYTQMGMILGSRAAASGIGTVAINFSRGSRSSIISSNARAIYAGTACNRSSAAQTMILGSQAYSYKGSVA